MKKMILLFCLLLSFTSFSQVEGTWSGAIQLPVAELPFVVHINQENNTIKASFDSPDQGAFGIEIPQVSFQNETLYLHHPQMKMVYQGKVIAPNTIQGTFTQNGQSFTLNLSRSEFTRNRPQEPKPPYNYKSQDITFENKQDGITLSGSLTLPNGKGKFPGVILVSGSGPNDRNQEIFGHKPFLVLADYLTNNGYAVLRYDKRGVASSQGDYEKATTYDFANDAKAGLAYLKSRQEIDDTKIGILGHSEGAMIAQIIASEDPTVDFIILMAGPGIANDQLMIFQKTAIEQKMGVPQNVLTINQEVFGTIYSIMKKNTSNQVAKQQIIEYLKTVPYYQNLSQSDIKTFTSLVDSNWFRTFISYDPKNYLSRINCNVLALNGTKDLQVTSIENLQGIHDALSSKGKLEIRSYQGLNHLFQKSETGMPQEYGKIQTTIEPEVLEDIGVWLNKKVK
ncbi:alpha/beta hydrolase family protein [Myroides sp. LJL119]